MFPNHKDNGDTDLLQWCLKRDIVWCLADALLQLSDTTKLIGSWTAFNKSVTSVKVNKSVLEYLLVIPKPPEYPVCKHFLNGLLQLMLDVDIWYIYAHSDEQVYARLAHIIWAHPDIYRNDVILMGGFHQLRVLQHMLFKRHGCRGFISWWVDAGVIASGSADKAADGGHYYRSLRLHKETFNALVQFRMESLTSNYEKLDADLFEKLKDLKEDPKTTTLNAVIDTLSFQKLFKEVLHQWKELNRK